MPLAIAVSVLCHGVYTSLANFHHSS